MKQLTIILITCISLITNAQSKYEQGMSKAFSFWEKNELTKAKALFERISNAEQNQWLPAYYVAKIEILSSFGIQDENKLNAKLEKAQTFLTKAAKISPENAEIIIAKALLNTAYISFDSRKYGMTLAIKNNELYARAIKLEPNNPRVVLNKAQWNIGSAQYFKQSIKPYCKEVKKAIELAKKEEKTPFYPKFSEQRALTILKKCKL